MPVYPGALCVPHSKKTLRICSVCHRLIESEDENWLPVPISLKPDGSYQFVHAHAECMEGATL